MPELHLTYLNRPDVEALALTAEEILLVSTTRDVQAVHNCDGRDLPAPGPVTRRALKKWAEREPQDSDP